MLLHPAWFSGEHSGSGLTVGHYDLRDLLQPQLFYESIILWGRKTIRSHTPGEGGQLGLSGGANMVYVGFCYYLNVVSLHTHSRTLGHHWLARDLSLWFVCDNSKHWLSPSPTTAPLCEVQYRDQYSCASWGWWFLLVCIFSPFYVEKRARMRISVSDKRSWWHPGLVDERSSKEKGFHCWKQ